MQRDVKKLIELQKKRHMFNRYRIHARYLGVPYWLSFSIVDYLLQPDLFRSWLGLRLVAAAYMLGSFVFLAKSK